MILVASWLAWGVHAFSPGALREIKVPLVATLGVLAGLILNPYFPKNLEFYWIQIGKIAVANTASATRVGSEWYSLGLSTVPLNAVVLMLFIGALFCHFLAYSKANQGVRSYTSTYDRILWRFFPSAPGAERSVAAILGILCSGCSALLARQLCAAS